MRIIGGKWKGRRLTSFRAEHIRPTTDRVKESLFNILRHDIEGSRILDLFAGTGNLGFEALSREASYVEMVESHKTSLKIINENKVLLKVPTVSLRVLSKDVFKYLRDYKGPSFDLVFIDPPFTEKIAHDVMQTLSTSAVLRHGGLAIIESSSQERIDDSYGVFQLLDRREFGDKSASIFRREHPANEA